MPRHEGHHQPAAAPQQLRQREQANKSGQPQVDRAGVDDERAAQKRAEVPMAEVVQVGAGMTDHPVLHLRTEKVQS